MSEVLRGRGLDVGDFIANLLVAAGFCWAVFAGWDTLPVGVAVTFLVACTWVLVRVLVRLIARTGRPTKPPA